MSNEIPIISQNDLAALLAVPAWLVRSIVSEVLGNRPKAYLTVPQCIKVYDELKQMKAAIPFLATRKARQAPDSKVYSMLEGTRTSNISLAVISETVIPRRISPDDILDQLALIYNIESSFDVYNTKSGIRKIQTADYQMLCFEPYGLSQADTGLLSSLLSDAEGTRPYEQTYYPPVTVCPKCDSYVLHPDVGCVQCIAKQYIPELL